MLELYIVSLLTLSDAATVLFKETPLFVKSCIEGEIVKNECIECICSENHVYECTKSTNLCTQNNSLSLCHRSQIYVMDDIICICNRSGHWPHEQCNRIFKSFESPAIENSCKPNSYVTNDCNVCRCGADGKIDKVHCTKNQCNNTKRLSSRTRKFSHQNVYGNCEVKNWYSLAPCQFCFCLNVNKLVCNTGNVYAQRLELGAYNLSHCGKDLIREATKLIPGIQESLRYGVEKENKTLATKTEIPIKKIEIGENNVDIKVNREEHELKTQVVQDHNKNDDEYYTDSEDEKSEIKDIARDGSASTQLPYEEVENLNDVDADRQESGKEGESDQEIEPVIIVQEFKAPISNNQQKNVATLLANLNLGALKLNLPMVLEKVFQIALKKSMVTVKSDTSCNQGVTSIFKCNVCFCIKENHLLCTNNVCE